MGAPGEDVRLSPVARECVNLSIECKNVEKLNVWACLQQCEANTKEGATPCLVFTRNRSPTYAVVPWHALLALHAPRTDSVPPRVRALIQDLAGIVASEAGGEGGGDGSPAAA